MINETIEKIIREFDFDHYSLNGLKHDREWETDLAKLITEAVQAEVNEVAYTSWNKGAASGFLSRQAGDRR